MTNYAQNNFGIDLSNITNEILINYFSENRLESNLLEFKSFPPQANFEILLTKIMKTICGFLNASGGLLILGAPVKNTINNVDYYKGTLTPVPIQKSIDWLINKISSGISPMPININVQIIAIEESFIYVFEVQESKYKPHQFEHTYFIRLDGQTKPAPHYIVQALMRQITYPDLRATLRINSFKVYAGERVAKLGLGIFNFSQLQNEVDYNYVLTLIGGAKFLGWENYNLGNNTIVNMEGAQLVKKPISDPLHFGVPYVKSYNLLIPNDVEELRFLFTFGGRFSPAKIVIYRLSFLNIHIQNPQANIVIEKDNELLEPKQTIEETLAHFRNTEII